MVLAPFLKTRRTRSTGHLVEVEVGVGGLREGHREG